MAADIIVLSFTDAALRTEPGALITAHEIYRWYRKGWRVLAVSSVAERAIPLREALECPVNSQPSAAVERALHERCTSLLIHALDRAGIPACAVESDQIATTAHGHPHAVALSRINRDRIMQLLKEACVIVISNESGGTADQKRQALEAGGSDVAAVYVTRALDARRLRFIRDPACIDQAGFFSASSCVDAIGYAEIIERTPKLLDRKAVRLLQLRGNTAEVAGYLSSHETLVGPFARHVSHHDRPPPPMKALLLGLGTVGFGVFQRMASMPAHFTVSGVLVRDRTKHAAKEIRSDLLHHAPDDVADSNVDVMVDMLPGFEISERMARHFLSRGISVVSANKQLIVEAGPRLQLLAARTGASLLYSAAVGGSAPMIEALRQETVRSEIQCLAAVLNGTCNYVLDRCSEGMLLTEAVRLAIKRGFAEPDPAEDLSGRDAARKLRILVRHAFGEELAGLSVEAINAATVLRTRRSLRTRETMRLIARAWKLGNRVLGQVKLEIVSTNDGFAQTREDWNRLELGFESGRNIVIRGRGGGRWPTTEAIVADLLELSLARNRAQH